MSLSWANKFAKNALLNAQKRIDSVLDIKESEKDDDDDDDNEEEEEADADEAERTAKTAESTTSIAGSFLSANDDEASHDLTISINAADDSNATPMPSTSAIEPHEVPSFLLSWQAKSTRIF